MVSKERLNAILSSKDTWLCAAAAALLLTIWGGVMTPRTANIGLCLVVLLASAGVYFNHNLLDDPWYIRIFWTAAIGGSAGIFCYYILWTHADPKNDTLNLEYRVLGVEKQTWDQDTRFEHKAIQVSVQIVNLSSRAKSLEFVLHIPVLLKDGTASEIRTNARWHHGAAGSLRYPQPAPRGMNSVSVPGDSTIECRLLCDLPTEQFSNILKATEWSDLELGKAYFVVSDRVSRKSLTGPFRGYPRGNERPYLQMEYPRKFVKVGEEGGKPQYVAGVVEAIGVDDEYARRVREEGSLQYYEEKLDLQFSVPPQEESESTDSGNTRLKDANTR